MSVVKPLTLALALLAAACSAKAMGPPGIVVDRTACSQCGMFVSEPVYAAAFQVHGNDAWVFDDIGCMLEALRRATASPNAIWVQDAGGSGWLDADDAMFVASPRLSTPMNGQVIAFSDAAAAARAEAAHHGTVVQSVSALLARNGGTK